MTNHSGWDGTTERRKVVRAGDLNQRLAILELQWAEFIEPDHGRFAKLETAVADMVDMRTQAKGGIRLLMMLGSVAVAGASVWAFFADYVYGLVRVGK